MRLGGLLLVWFLLAGAWGAGALAATYEPTRFDDPTPGKCKPDNCSLREAIKASNDHEGRDTVLLGRGTYELEIPGSGLDSGSIDLVDSVVMRGQGPGKTKVDANGIDKVAECWLDFASDSYTLEGLTLTDGDAGPDPNSSAGGFNCGGSGAEEVRLRLTRVAITHSSASENGGGLQIGEASRVTIVRSRFSKNEALRGGGIILLPRINGSVVSIRDSVLSGNEAAFGGGLYSGAELTIQRSTISGNAGDEGGGIDLVASAGAEPMTLIRSSTISGNTTRKGGGILADGNQPGPGGQEPVVTLLNSTVAGNQASAEGGGIMADNGATMNLDNSTVAYNAADSDGVAGGVGGGVYQHSGAVFGLGDSVVAQNTLGLPPGTAQQCEGSFGTSDGLVRQTQASGTCSFSGIYTIVADAVIGPLADNGGPTQTVALRTGSPAIGFTDGCPGRDQRGKPRPDDDCDAGAFERKGP